MVPEAESPCLMGRLGHFGVARIVADSVSLQKQPETLILLPTRPSMGSIRPRDVVFLL